MLSLAFPYFASLLTRCKFPHHKCYEFYDFIELIWQFKLLSCLRKLHEIHMHYRLCLITKRRHQKHLRKVQSDMDIVSPNICTLHMFYKLADFNNLLRLNFLEKNTFNTFVRLKNFIMHLAVNILFGYNP